MLWLLLVCVVALVLLIAWAQLGIRSMRPAVYTVAAASDVEPYVRSWGQWLETRGQIVVQDPASGAEAEFRKQRHKTRPDVLAFRYRNADSTRKSFDEIRSRFDSAGVEYQLEHTKKQQKPRALTVPLDPKDVFTPVAAVRLVSLALGADAELRVWCEGRLRPASDAPSVGLIPQVEGRRAGFRVGRALARLLR